MLKTSDWETIKRSPVYKNKIQLYSQKGIGNSGNGNPKWKWSNVDAQAYYRVKPLINDYHVNITSVQTLPL